MQMEHWAGFFPSPEGRPALHPRLVAGLMCLQHAYDLSDEAVLARCGLKGPLGDAVFAVLCGFPDAAALA